MKVSQLETNNGQLGWLPKNPRQWTQTDIDRTKASIQEDTDFLEDRPLLVCPGLSGKYVVFGGNLRLTAARSLKLKEVPVVVYCLDEGGPEQDEIRETVKRRAMKDNGSFGAWDYDALANEWDDLPLQDWGVPAWEGEAVPATPEVKEDDFNEDAEVETRCNPGDIWQLGDHRLMCGDSTDGGNVALLMDGAKADMVFTDPPYGYEYERHIENPKFEMIMNDDKILDFFPQVSSFVGGFVFVCTMWKVLDKWIPLFKKYFPLSNMLIWDKGGGGLGDLKTTFSSDYEIILCSHNKGQITGKRLGSIWRINKDSGTGYSHPTQKPVALPAMAISAVTIEGDRVLDLFGGSGTTLIAAEQLGRRCYMMELDPHYCDVIMSRWETFTGKTAQLITPGDKVS